MLDLNFVRANLALVEIVERLTRPTLRAEAGWVADYVRLRVVAVRGNG